MPLTRRAAAEAKPASTSGSSTLPTASKFKRAFQRGQEWEKDDLQTVLFWALNALSCVLGVACGALGLTGYFGFLTYIVTSFVGISYYCTHLLDVDTDEFGGKSELLQEGYMSSTGLFLFTWTITYTFVYVDLLGYVV
ncbi:hypothetical protein H4R34_004433 [Dimargaris verticillata]|uniref:ER membrane protein complex subunit 6 n=1 Tax=Dimargaris verticillata TaxID=2761393 RepID=A0A9W8B0L9_9FUNG|nr:hypothetical protein H4R34_004433 [Dimargaris verticillata]